MGEAGTPLVTYDCIHCGLGHSFLLLDYAAASLGSAKEISAASRDF